MSKAKFKKVVNAKNCLVSDGDFTGLKININGGSSFYNCTFIGCTFIGRGKSRAQFQGCRFK
mgnify:CR=1 FL=1